MTSEYQRLLIPTLCAALAAWLLVAFTVPVQAEAPKQRTLWDLAGGSLTVGEVAYEKGDYAKAAHHFRIAAEKNDRWSADAQYNLGVMYSKGKGVPQGYAEAMKWYRKAAAQGKGSAQYNLGIMYDEGQGVPQDYAEAVKWYRKAADQGGAQAQNNLGAMYVKGQGVSQDYVQAHMWFNLAASRHRPGAKRDTAVKNRDLAAKRMTPADVSKAQRLAREWKPKKEGK